nr:hypothetical protein [Tanacetum cinerariifolium]
ATKRSKKDFNISHESSSGDGVDTQSKVPDEHQQKTSDLRYIKDITYLTDVNVDYLHQPWRAFSTVINKCLSGKETGIDKIRLSRAQMGWLPKEARKTLTYHMKVAQVMELTLSRRTEFDSDVILNLNKTNEEHKKEDENIDEEEDDEVTKELYKDVNVNLANKD